MLQKCYGCLAPETKKKQRRKKEETNLENKQKILWKYKFEITDVEF